MESPKIDRPNFTDADKKYWKMIKDTQEKRYKSMETETENKIFYIDFKNKKLIRIQK